MPLSGGNEERTFVILAPVPGPAIQQDEPGVHLVLAQLESKLLHIPRDHDGDDSCSRVSFSQVVPEEPQMPAASRSISSPRILIGNRPCLHCASALNIIR